MRQCPTCYLWVDDTQRQCQRCHSLLTSPPPTGPVRRILLRALPLSVIASVYALTVAQLWHLHVLFTLVLVVADSVAFTAICHWFLRRTTYAEWSTQSARLQRLRSRYDICLMMAYLLMFLFVLSTAMSADRGIAFAYTPAVLDRLTTAIDGLFFVILFLIAGLFLRTAAQERQLRPGATRRRLSDLVVLLGYFLFATASGLAAR